MGRSAEAIKKRRKNKEYLKVLFATPSATPDRETSSETYINLSSEKSMASDSESERLSDTELNVGMIMDITIDDDTDKINQTTDSPWRMPNPGSMDQRPPHSVQVRVHSPPISDPIETADPECSSEIIIIDAKTQQPISPLAKQPNTTSGKQNSRKINSSSTHSKASTQAGVPANNMDQILLYEDWVRLIGGPEARTRQRNFVEPNFTPEIYIHSTHTSVPVTILPISEDNPNTNNNMITINK